MVHWFRYHLAVFVTLLFTVVSFAVENSSTCFDGKTVMQIRYVGLEATKPHVVDRELLNASGKPFSLKNFETEKLNLENLDLFSNVDLVCTKSGDGQNLEYRFTELLKWIPAPAGKKTDQDGWLLGLALANLNVGGEDIRVEAQTHTSISPLLDAKDFAIYASSPWLFGLPIAWNLELSYTDLWDDLRDFHDRTWYAHLETDAKIWNDFYWIWAPTYRYVEDYGAVPDLGTGVLMDKRDSKLDPHFGAYEEFRVTRYGVFYNDVEDYVEYLWDNRLYVTFGRFITGAFSFVRYRPGNQMFFDRLHQGGLNTFRGLAPDSSVHGRHEAIWNVEERFELLKRRPFSVMGANLFWGMQLVAGVEGSFLWDTETPNWGDYRQSVYAGIHLLVPALDRIRIEAGYSPDGGSIKIDVALYEKTETLRWRSR